MMISSLVQHCSTEANTLLTARELASLLEVTEEAIRLRHKAGGLIAILRAGSGPSRGFPVFQVWPGIDGEPLEHILRALGYQGPLLDSCTSAAQAYQFFTCIHELLGGLTPIQVLTGVGADVNDQEAVDFLAKPHEERLNFVLSVAEATHAYERCA